MDDTYFITKAGTSVVVVVICDLFKVRGATGTGMVIQRLTVR